MTTDRPHVDSPVSVPLLVPGNEADPGMLTPVMLWLPRLPSCLLQGRMHNAPTQETPGKPL